MPWLTKSRLDDIVTEAAEKAVSDYEEKLNPSQSDIASIVGGGEQGSKEIITSYTVYYEHVEVVNRGVNMIVDDVAEIPIEVMDGKPGIVKGIRKTTLAEMLNWQPNPFQDISSFKRNLIIDYLLDGNIFLYFDGRYIYHMPANYMTIEADSKTYVRQYKFQGSKPYTPEEIIHIKENSFYSIYRGTSRLRCARRSMASLVHMGEFQDNFFKNGAVPGLVIKSPNTLSEKIKERMIQSWMTKYRPNNGGRRPLVLDGGLTVEALNDVNFREMAFEESIQTAETRVLKALGIPPIILDGGNQANIRPNHRLYYLETVLPIVEKLNAAIGRFFGYQLRPVLTDIPALQPELKDQAQYFAGLVNGGIITGDEAREELGREPMNTPEMSEIRVPQNIAGSAANPAEGGRPPGDEE